ncbi:hypothetical protein HK101_000749 [Irineochytrium annulatum]|nr:hypothetical protein HK101_000749 [Irineochytrium annulatum]
MLCEHNSHIYRDRHDAGRRLTGLPFLSHLRSSSSAVILAIPRGGVPVAYELARSLNLPLDLILSRKLGHPQHPEVALGAVSLGGVVHMDGQRGRLVSADAIEEIKRREVEEMGRRDKTYRKGRRPDGPPDVRGKEVVIVDDGIATGATMIAAIKAVKKLGARRVVAVAPVGSPDSVEEVGSFADEVHVPLQPLHFRAVGEFYVTFAQTTDKEVIDIMSK